MHLFVSECLKVYNDDKGEYSLCMEVAEEGDDVIVTLTSRIYHMNSTYVMNVQFNRAEFRYFFSRLNTIIENLLGIKRYRGCNLQEQHVGGNMYIDVVNINGETFVLLYRAIYDKQRNFLIRGSVNQIGLSEEDLYFLQTEIERRAHKIFGVKNVNDAPLCAHNRGKNKSCLICCPLHSRD